MAIANIQATLLEYTMQKADLTLQLSNIMSRISVASKQTLSVSQEYKQNRTALEQYAEAHDGYSDTTEYSVKSQAITDDYHIELAEINSWEEELEAQKNNIQTQLNVIEKYEESWESLRSNNIKRDFSYSASSS